MTVDQTFPVEVIDATILSALPNPVLVVNEDCLIGYLNPAAETLLGASRGVLVGRSLTELWPVDSPLFRMIEQARHRGSTLADYDLPIESPRIGSHFFNVQVAPLGERSGHIVVTLQERSIAQRLHRQMTFRGAARSVTAMAAMLAHEVKNPLSGIRGAAQLLEQNLGPEDTELTQLICDETDRIVGLVDRMEVFADERPIQRVAGNIHEVLDRCRRISEAGFGRNIHFVERYDPSLPPVLGNRDLLIQVFVNLLKNACEAAPSNGGEVVMTTSYRHGMRVSVAGSEERVDLPLQVTIHDNGPGIQEDLKQNLFEPFVTGRENGTGLGLAFVAKAVEAHGGIIEVDSEPGQTVFKLTFPITEPEIVADEDRANGVPEEAAR